jgi:Domain of unknown function (DUF4314)
MRQMNNKEDVKIGDRIKLVRTDDKFAQLKPGDLGTVWEISIFNIEIDGKPVKVVWISWDSGSKFALIEGKDEFEIL